MVVFLLTLFFERYQEMLDVFFLKINPAVKVDYPAICFLMEDLLEKAGILEGSFDLCSGEIYQKKASEVFIEKSFKGGKIRLIVPAGPLFSCEVFLQIPREFGKAGAKKLHATLYFTVTGEELSVSRKIKTPSEIWQAIFETYPRLRLVPKFAKFAR